MLQEINIARNEVKARKGEYLPFVNVQGAAGVERAARYTRAGAVDESTEIEPGKAIPAPLPDYLITMRAPGEVVERVRHSAAEYPVAHWQKIASPIWMDINPSDTLQYASAREAEDERHICPLQLEVVRRGIELWTNPGEIVLSPFAGIGSEGYAALQMGRRFIGIELKQSYYNQAAINLARAQKGNLDLFNDHAAA